MDELTLHHIQSAVGSPTQDISPFVATSTCPGGANPSRTLMILNVPISEVAGPGEDKYDGFEVLVTGSIKPEWITAVAELHKGSHTANKLSTLVQALGGEENTIESSVFRNSEIHRKSRQNRPKDLREINKDLIEEILSAQNVDADALNVEFNRLGIDTYQAALWTTANYYLKKLHKIEIASLKDLDEIEAAELVAPESAHTRYQYDDVTPYRLESSDPGMVNSAKELNIKEIEILADMYACRLESYKKSL